MYNTSPLHNPTDDYVANFQTPLQLQLYRTMFDAVGANCSLTGGNGISGGNFDVYGANRIIPRSMTAFTAIAWYNAIEILVLIFFVFKKYNGLYFWSLLITTLSVVPYASGKSSLGHELILLMKLTESRCVAQAKQRLPQLPHHRSFAHHGLGDHGSRTVISPLLAASPHLFKLQTPPNHILDHCHHRRGSLRPNCHAEFAPIHKAPSSIYPRLRCHGEDTIEHLHRSGSLHLFILLLGDPAHTSRHHILANHLLYSRQIQHAQHEHKHQNDAQIDVAARGHERAVADSRRGAPNSRIPELLHDPNDI
jgi:hypothetical protein